MVDNLQKSTTQEKIKDFRSKGSGINAHGRRKTDKKTT